MKQWAKERRRQMEAAGAKELAEVFTLVIKICELEEELKATQDSDGW
jgi:hypothetical protein